MSKSKSIKLEWLREAFDLASAGQLGGFTVYLDMETGDAYVDGLFGDEQPLPDNVDDETRYLEVPNKSELGLGRPLATRFASIYLPDDEDTVWEYFRKRGAYSRFKDLLERRGMLQQWFDYEQQQVDLELRAWCEEQGISVAD